MKRKKASCPIKHLVWDGKETQRHATCWENGVSENSITESQTKTVCWCARLGSPDCARHGSPDCCLLSIYTAQDPLSIQDTAHLQIKATRAMDARAMCKTHGCQDKGEIGFSKILGPNVSLPSPSCRYLCCRLFFGDLCAYNGNLHQINVTPQPSIWKKKK